MSKFLKIALISLIVLIVIAVAFFVCKFKNNDEPVAPEVKPVSKPQIEDHIGNKELTIVGKDGTTKVVYKLELAQTIEELSNGLMNRESLDADSGMLFDLRRFSTQTAMWMKDTKIPLDMLFIDNEGMIYWIYENAEPDSTQMILPPYNAAAVLEINGGDAQKNGIKIGDTVQHDWFNTAQPAAAEPDENLEAVNKAVEDIKQATDEVVEKAQELTSQAAESAKQAAEDAKEVAEKMEKAADQAIENIKAATAEEK